MQTSGLRLRCDMTRRFLAESLCGPVIRRVFPVDLAILWDRQFDRADHSAGAEFAANRGIWYRPLN